MKPDRATYEAWLLDRIEGKLSSAQERQLDAFLAANPDLDAARGELPTIGDEALSFDMKAELKKSFPPTGEPDAVRLNDFLAARLEGDLNSAQEKALDRFLYEHPDAQRDAELMSVSKADNAPVAFTSKSSIERSFPPQGLPDEHRLTDFLIAAEEGDLGDEQRAALFAWLQAHPEAQHEQRLIAAAHVVRERVVFFNKERLKKREVRVIALWQRYAAAASIALLIGLSWWFLRNGNGDEEHIARNGQSPTHSPEQHVPLVARGMNDSASAVQQLGDVRSRQDHEPVTPSRIGAPGNSIAPKTIPLDRDPSVQEPRLAQEEVVPQSPLREAVREGVGPDTTAMHREEVPMQQPDPAPLMAQEEVVPRGSGAVTAPEENNAVTLAAFAANTVRKEVLDAPQRGTGLDGNDALAMVDKGVRAITGGEGGVQVQRSGPRQHIGLRLGRGFAISASRGR